GEVPDEAEAWRSVVVKVVEGQVAGVVTVRLLVIKTNTKAELEVLGEFPIVAGVEAFHVGVGSTDKLKVTNAGGIPENERITKRFRGGDGGCDWINSQTQRRQCRARKSQSTVCTGLGRAGDGGATHRAD